MNNNFVAKALRLTLAVALAGTLAPQRAQSESRERPVASYILALAWSPTYCETDRRREDQPQCSGGRRYAFILHGLWPQWARGGPEFCPSAQGKYVPEKIVRSMLDIMPARGLVIHQYRKHGTCSGLSPSAYFDRARELFQGIRIPARYVSPHAHIYATPRRIREDFLAANPSLQADMIAISCGRRGRLRDIRICLSKDFEPTPCGSNENRKRLCRSPRIVMPPVRGGP